MSADEKPRRSSICIPEVRNFIEATIVRECPNRFRIVIEVNGLTALCYVPYSSKLSKCLQIEERKVLVSHRPDEIGMPFQLRAIRGEKTWQLIDQQMISMALRQYLLDTQGIRFLVSEKDLIGGYRADFCSLDRYSQLWEVKTILSESQIVTYPNTRTLRAEHQMAQISKLCDMGYEATLLFALLSPSIRFVEIAKEYINLRALIHDLLAKGLRVEFCHIQLIGDTVLCEANEDVRFLLS